MTDRDDEARRLFEAALSQSGDAPEPLAPPPNPEEMNAHFPELEILEVLGQGGMGVVYRARQRRLDRVVALKVLPRSLSDDPQFQERFLREARTLAKLSHRNIVGVYEFGESDGLLYLVMEFVEGVTLRQLMAVGNIPAAQALAIVPQICEALQYAHEQGVVHRDIKPENVLVNRGGHVKVADFGLAKLQQRGPGELTLTGTGQVMGTLHYMAPEQYKTPNDVDHRADIFSLGVVFYEMLTGELPVGRFAKPSEAGDLDERLDEIVMRALERERDLRYQAAQEIEDDVRTVIDMPDAPPPAVTPDAPVVAAAAPAPVSAPELPERSLRLVWCWLILTLSAPLGLAAYGLSMAFRDDRHMNMQHEQSWLLGWAVAAILAAIAGFIGVGELVSRIAKPRPGRKISSALIPVLIAFLVASLCVIQFAHIRHTSYYYLEHWYWFWQD